MSTIEVEDRGRVRVVSINRPDVRNAVDTDTAIALAETFEQLDRDPDLHVGILTGAGGTFCAGADLAEIADGRDLEALTARGWAPMGSTRLDLSKPVIAAIEGHAVAGGLELALWCDLRVAAYSSILGVLNRRFGVPLIDLGTIRLPRIIGQGRALDLILTGRGVGAEEALAMGLVNRVVPDGQALAESIALAEEIAHFPQVALRNDRRSVLMQWGLDRERSIELEMRLGLESLESGDAQCGARRFTEGAGRHGAGSV